MRRVLAVSALASLLVAGGARADGPAAGPGAGAGARANDERAECAHAFERAQRLQQSGENRKALDAAERCAQPSCPALLAEECKPWVTQIRQQLAQIEVRVSGPDGCAMRDAAIEIDRVKHLPWTEIYVDAGIHEVRAVDPSTTRVVDKTVNVARREKRLVELSFVEHGESCGGPAPSPAPGGAPVPKAVVGLGIAGGGLLVVGVALGIAGAVKRGDLDDCKPSCSNDRLDGVRPFFVAGDVLGAAGIVTLGVAAAVYFLGRGDAGIRATSLRVAPRGVEVAF